MRTPALVPSPARLPRRATRLAAGLAGLALALATGCSTARSTAVHASWSGASAVAAATATGAGGDRPVIGLQHEGPIRVVYQISRDEWKDGVGKGLFYLEKLHQSYLDAGVSPARLDVRAVFHGRAADHLLVNETWDAWRDVEGGNPNAELVAELLERGVSLELCDTRREANGWSKDDVLPGVLLVTGAYQRVIDLQQQGYAYIRF